MLINTELKNKKLDLIPFLIWFKDSDLEKEYNYFRFSNPKINIRKVILYFVLFYSAVLLLDIFLLHEVDVNFIIFKIIITLLSVGAYFLSPKITFKKYDWFVIAFSVIAFMSIIIQIAFFPANIFHFTPIGYTLLVFVTYFLLNLRHIEAFVVNIIAQFLFYYIFLTIHFNEVPVKMIIVTVTQMNILFFILSYFNEISNRKIFLFTRNLLLVNNKESKLNKSVEKKYLDEINKLKNKYKDADKQNKAKADLKNTLNKLAKLLLQEQNIDIYNKVLILIKELTGTPELKYNVLLKNINETIKKENSSQITINTEETENTNLKSYIPETSIVRLNVFLIDALKKYIIDNKLQFGISVVDENNIEIFFKFKSDLKSDIIEFIEGDCENNKELRQLYIFAEILKLQNIKLMYSSDNSEYIEIFYNLNGVEIIN